mmetsp:Transcript_51413/g.60098  ORF Transcript_51413/g.60098 Transcript_51413/m.60098 type:complete len:135 (+) Transcript_51413:133-537(+)
MVLYECVLTTKHSSPYYALTNLMKSISYKVVENGGIVRGVQNHGIRSLPHRFKARYPDIEGNRYYKDGRFVSIYYDSSPQIMRDVESILFSDEEVLRSTHIKARNKLWYVNVQKEDKNPYLQRVIAEEKGEGDL